MENPSQVDTTTLPVQLLLDQLCDRFEVAWESGSIPDIARYLSQVDLSQLEQTQLTVRRGQLVEQLVKIDLEYRWSRADRETTSSGGAETCLAVQQTSPSLSSTLPLSPRLEDYFQRYSDLGPLDQVSLDLIRVEYRARHQWGDRPGHQEYANRFGSLEELEEALCQMDDELALDNDGQGSPDQTNDHASGAISRLRIRCPHCHNAIEILADTECLDMTCSVCGSHFSLAGDEQAQSKAPALRTIGHFELVERLGVGGFGTVWKARDTQLGRMVAVKIPRKGQLDREETEKFLREARAAAQLTHPNIVAVHEVGFEDDTLYIVSDLVRGVPLSDWIKEQPLTEREAALLCRDIAEALHHAHQKGIVHRDLKPQNVMIDGNGEPHIMDFGLAKRDAGEITLTLDGQLLGTPAYMSPEQAELRAHQSDRRTDVYSLGVLLFELTTGELPFRGTRSMLLFQIITREPPSPRVLNSTISPDIETICLKCLEKSPSRRYATARELADDLDRHLASKPILARPITKPARAWRWCKRNPWKALAGVLVLILAVGAPLAALDQAKLRGRTEAAYDEKVSYLVRMNRENRYLKEQLKKAGITDIGESGNTTAVTEDGPRAALRTSLIESAWDEYQAFVDGLPDDRMTQKQQIHAYVGLALIANEIDPALAKNRFEQAREILEMLCHENPTNKGFQLELARCHRFLAPAQLSLDVEEADIRSKQVKNIENQLAQDEPLHRREYFDLWRTNNRLKVNQGTQINLIGTIERHTNSLRIRQSLVNAHPTALRYQVNLAKNYVILGDLQHQDGQLDSARESFHEAIRLYGNLTGESSTEWESRLGSTYNSLALVLRDLDRHKESLKALQDAISHQMTTFSQAPNVVEYRRLLRENFHGLATICREMNDTDVVSETLKRNLAPLWPRDPVEVYYIACCLAECEPLLADSNLENR